jgi:hypothetical protein
MVKNQILNLTPIWFPPLLLIIIHAWKLGPNKQCKGILSIWASKPFYGHLRSPTWCLFAFPTKTPKIHNSHMSATSKVGVYLGVVGLHPLHFSHLWKCFSHLNTFFWPHGPLYSTFSCNPMLGCNKNIRMFWRFPIAKVAQKKIQIYRFHL